MIIISPDALDLGAIRMRAGFIGETTAKCPDCEKEVSVLCLQEKKKLEFRISPHSFAKQVGLDAARARARARPPVAPLPRVGPRNLSSGRSF